MARSRGLGDVYKRQDLDNLSKKQNMELFLRAKKFGELNLGLFGYFDFDFAGFNENGVCYLVHFQNQSSKVAFLFDLPGYAFVENQNAFLTHVEDMQEQQFMH
jgi:hypothetical protein